MFTTSINTFIPLPELHANFLSLPKPDPQRKGKYQQCLACEFKFYGSIVHRKSHVTGKDINGVRVKACLRPNKTLVKEILEKLVADELFKNSRKAESGIESIRWTINYFKIARLFKSI